jgi:hypothetical protein
MARRVSAEGCSTADQEPLKILTARCSDFVLFMLDGVSGSSTVAVPAHVFTSDRSVVFV